MFLNSTSSFAFRGYLTHNLKGMIENKTSDCRFNYDLCCTLFLHAMMYIVGHNIRGEGVSHTIHILVFPTIINVAS